MKLLGAILMLAGAFALPFLHAPVAINNLPVEIINAIVRLGSNRSIAIMLFGLTIWLYAVWRKRGRSLLGRRRSRYSNLPERD